MSGFTTEQIKLAQDTQKKYGVPASVTLAQFGLESAFGTSRMARAQNNFFGIKGSYNGQSSGGFRVYSSMAESFDDHGNLLSQPLYANKTANATNVTEYVKAFAETYAPASDGNNNYAGQILKIISDYDLTKYDSGRYGGGITTPGSEYINGSSSSIIGGIDSVVSDQASSLLSSIIRITTLLALVILTAVFFITAFDISIPKLSGGAKID